MGRNARLLAVQTFRCAAGCALLAVAAITAAQNDVRLDGSGPDPRVAAPGTRAVVLLFISTDCPISNRYAPEIRRLAERFGPSGVVFRLVYPNPSETPDAIREHMASYGYAGIMKAFRDPELALATSSGVSVTPEAVIYTGSRIVYRGRIDDRYVDLGRERASPTVHDLADALGAIVEGKPLSQKRTQPVGCFIADFKR